MKIAKVQMLLNFFIGFLFSTSSIIVYIDTDFSNLFLPCIASALLLKLVSMGCASAVSASSNRMHTSLFIIFTFIFFLFSLSNITGFYDYINLRDSILFLIILILVIPEHQKYYFNNELSMLLGLATPLAAVGLISLCIVPFSIPYSGIMSNPNSMGILMSFLFFTLLIAMDYLKEKRNRFLTLIGGGLIVASSFFVLSSLSRTSIISSLLVLLLFQMLWGVRLRFLALVCAFSIIIYIWGADLIHESFEGVMNKVENNSNMVSGRDVIFEYYSNKVFLFGGAYYDGLYPVDNTALKLSMKYGLIPVLVLYLVITYTLIVNIVNRSSWINVICVVFFIMVSMMETIYYSVPFFIFLYYILAERRSGFDS